MRRVRRTNDDGCEEVADYSHFQAYRYSEARGDRAQATPKLRSVKLKVVSVVVSDHEYQSHLQSDAAGLRTITLQECPPDRVTADPCGARIGLQTP